MTWTGGLSPLDPEHLANLKRRKPWLNRGSAEPGELRPPVHTPCAMRWTFSPHTKGIRVRCQCMAQVASPSPRFYNYDHLADVDTIPEAFEVWNRHRKLMTGGGGATSPRRAGCMPCDQTVSAASDTT